MFVFRRIGKTTLLDVLSGRKSTGVVTGSMALNGSPKDDESFRRAVGYVEQADALFAEDTVQEAIQFSACLRLHAAISDSDRRGWIERIIDMLELEPVRDSLIGSGVASGLSFEQRKRISIAVELAANPSILFLDGRCRVVLCHTSINQTITH